MAANDEWQTVGGKKRGRRRSKPIVHQRGGCGVGLVDGAQGTPGYERVNGRPAQDEEMILASVVAKVEGLRNPGELSVADKFRDAVREAAVQKWTSQGEIQGIICLGLGPLYSDAYRERVVEWQAQTGQGQLAGLLELVDSGVLGGGAIPRSRVVLYDPLFDALDEKILSKGFGMVVKRRQEGEVPEGMTWWSWLGLSKDQVGAGARVLFYMPHCPRWLMDSVLWAHWSPQELKRIAIIGNEMDGSARKGAEDLRAEGAYGGIARGVASTAVDLSGCEPKGRFPILHNDTWWYDWAGFMRGEGEGDGEGDGDRRIWSPPFGVTPPAQSRLVEAHQQGQG